MVHVEVTPGVVLVVAAWMLDAASCAGMELGAPRASMAALVDLHQLLAERGLRRSSCGVFHTDREEQDDPSTKFASDAASITRADDAAPTEHCVRVPGTPGNESKPTSQRGHSAGYLAAAGSGCEDAGGEQ